MRMPRGTAALVGFARDLREREIEKITITRGISREEIRGFVAALGDRRNKAPLPDQLVARGVRNITLGRVVVEDVSYEQAGMAARRRGHHGRGERLGDWSWDFGKTGAFDPGRNAWRGWTRTAPLMALTALKSYTTHFTHMVNVAALAMARPIAGLDGALLREFGFAALMQTSARSHAARGAEQPASRPEEFDIMKRPRRRRAHILRRTPEMPASPRSWRSSIT
jgi:hypothetical protein